MRRTLIATATICLAAACGDAGVDSEYGELVVCDEIEVIELGDGSAIRYQKAVYPGVEEGTASFRFCDFWSMNNGEYVESDAECTEGDNPFPGFYRDGDLHVVCSELYVSDDGSLEIGAGRIYVRFGDAGAADSSEYGQLLACDETSLSGNILQAVERIPTTPGEVLTITYCFAYWQTNGVDDPSLVNGDPDGCFSVDVVAEGSEYVQECTYTQPGLGCSDGQYEPGDGCDIFEYGHEEVYVQRTSEQSGSSSER